MILQLFNRIWFFLIELLIVLHLNTIIDLNYRIISIFEMSSIYEQYYMTDDDIKESSYESQLYPASL